MPDDQLSLFGAPAAPPPRSPYRGQVPSRRTSADTSRAAAARIKPKHRELQEQVLGFVRAAGGEGMTAEECGMALARARGEGDLYAYSTRSTAAARLSELKIAGQISDSGRRRRNRSGATAAVWVACSTPAAASPPPAVNQATPLSAAMRWA